MNWYRRDIGAYTAEAAHLSLLEHGAYSRLIDVYCARGGPIPADQAGRLVGARSADELAAVAAVLAEFFELDGGAWRHKRCDAEIDAAAEREAEATEREAEATARRENEAERQRRYRVRRRELFAQLRARGVVARFDATVAELENLASEPVTRDESVTSALCHGPVTATITARSLKKEKRKKEKEKEKEADSTESTVADAPAVRSPNGSRIPAGFPTVDLIEWAERQRPDLDVRRSVDSFRDYWLAAPGARGRKADWSATWRNWIRNERGAPRGLPALPVSRAAAAAARLGTQRADTRPAWTETGEITDAIATAAIAGRLGR
jgi:uncharacterized protein YdaU (DUF1376 family)